ncbi:MFS transporter [Arthrobacter sp. S39]|jgi:MFS family permease|uniref:MFS transporter n=1 Tax=Arthrobacter sp. S39 TaxID=2509720 RepID=UPI00103738C3|nr:MFS transporter [Arthrobacter sp. S39]TAP44933.1 MFS transporter [Arthrobacter sp. S39]
METPATHQVAAENDAPDRHARQRRTIGVLIAGQILGGLGMGASLSLGSLLAVQVSGSTAWSGMAATMNTLGAAAFAIPLARAAVKRGRGVSLAAGSLTSGFGAAIAIASAALSSFPALLIGLILLGAGTAVSFQARFAATDLSTPNTRGRDLSIVVWSTTIGAVSGPNLFEPGEAVGTLLHLPPLTGAFAFTVAAQLLAALVFYAGLRLKPPVRGPKPGKDSGTRTKPDSGFKILRRKPGARYAVTVVALSHGTMVALMAMTPVHLHNNGASLTVVGMTISLHIAGMFGLSPLFGWLSDRLGRIPVLLLGQAMLLASLVLAWLAPHTMVTPSLILLGLGWSASIVSGSALVGDSVSAVERGPLQGVSDLLMNLTGATCGALAGPVLAAVGYSGLGTGAMALVGIVTVWTLWQLLTRRRAPAS